MANSQLLILRVTTELATYRAWLELGISPMSFLAQQGDMEDDNQGEEDCCSLLSFLRQSGQRSGLGDRL